VALVERPDERHLDDGADDRSRHQAEHRSDEEAQTRGADRALELLGEPPRRVGADREEGAVREVEHAHEPIDQGEPRGDQEVHRAEAEAGDREQDERLHQ